MPSTQTEEELFSDCDDNVESDIVDQKHAEFNFVKDTNKSGAKSKPFKTTAEKAFKKNYHLHERIEGGCIPYGDYDELCPLTRPDDKYIKSIEIIIRQAVQKAYPGKKVIMGNRCGHSSKHDCYKISFRFWVRGAGFYKSTIHCGQEVLAKINPLLKLSKIKPLDKGAYKKNQNLGVVLNTKMGDKRILTITTPDIDPVLTLAQNIKGEELIIVTLNNEKGRIRECDGIYNEILESVKKFMPNIQYESHKGNGPTIISFKKSDDECPIHNCTHNGNRAFVIWFENTGYAYLKCHNDLSKKFKLGKFKTGSSSQDEKKRVFDKKDYKNCFREDQGLAEIFSRYHKNSIKIIDSSGNGYIYNSNNALWEEKEACDIMNSISPFLEKVVGEYLEIEVIRVQGLPVSEAGTLIPLKKLKRLVLTNSKSKSVFSKIRTMLKIEKGFAEKLNKIKHLFPVRNKKVINLKTGKAIERKKEHMFSFECPVDLIDETKFAEDFMNQICCERKPLLEYMQKLLGTCLSGEVHRKFYFWYGDGINGKTTITGCMNNFMGPYCSYVKKSLVIKTGKGNKEGSSHDSDLVEIDGIRVGFAKELDKKDELNSSRIKALADGSIIKARGAYSKQELSITPTLKMITETNHKPNVDTSDKAILDRVVYMPFDARFTKDPKKANEYPIDENIKENLLTDSKERNSFFSWLVKGAALYYAEGFNECKTLISSMSKSILEVDKLQQFIEECCDMTDGGQVKANDFYYAYKSWMTSEHNIQVETSKRQLTALVKNKGYSIKRSNGTTYQGISMKRQEKDYDFE